MRSTPSPPDHDRLGSRWIGRRRPGAPTWWGVAAAVCACGLATPAFAAPPPEDGGHDSATEPRRSTLDHPPHEDGPDLTDDERRALDDALSEDRASARGRTRAEGSTATASGVGANAMNPGISLILDAALAVFSDDEPLQVGAHDPTETGFNLQQLELHMAANVDPYFRLEAMVVFSLFGVEIEEAYGTTLALPGGLQLRAGQFLTRFGRLNPTHPHSWHFVDQPLVLGKHFGGEASRGLGLEVSWLSPLPWYAELVASATMPTGASTARSFFGGDDVGVRGPDDLLYTLALKQFWDLSDDWALMWGWSAQLGPNSTGLDNRSFIAGTDLYLRYHPVDDPDRSAVSLQVEVLWRSRQVPGEAVTDWGAYSQLVWNIDPTWEVGARWDFVRAAADDLDPHEDGDRHRLAVQGTFYPSHFSRVRLQVGRDDPAWREEPIWSAVLALELLIGAHGAHTY